jgi:anthranilate synthase component I
MTYFIHKMHADLETPVTAYLKLRSLNAWSFLLESVEGASRWATYSILGIGARRTFIANDKELVVHDSTGDNKIISRDPLAALKHALDEQPLTPKPKGAPRFVGGIFGFLAYDSVRSFEPLGQAPTEREVPDLYFWEPELLAVFDNNRHSLTLYSQDKDLLDRTLAALKQPLPAYVQPLAWVEPRAIDSRAEFQKTVEATQEFIRSGDIIQAVMSRRFELPRLADPFYVYRGLRTINPSPYMYYMQTPKLQIAGASPEVMVRVQNGKMTVRPIAGTRPRGDNQEEDVRLARELLADPKERAEHIMLVDLGRNDVGRVSGAGTVQVPELMVVERYSHVMHLVSEVQGQLDAKHTAFDAIRSAFPAGTLSGAPKVRAMQIIDDLEKRRRGIYGGAVGYFGPKGDADFGIAIRTLVAYPDKFVIQAGAGIVADSDPARETDETEAKAKAVFSAVQWATSKESAW